jgi:hypothetical protein
MEDTHRTNSNGAIHPSYSPPRYVFPLLSRWFLPRFVCGERGLSLRNIYPTAGRSGTRLHFLIVKDTEYVRKRVQSIPPCFRFTHFF